VIRMETSCCLASTYKTPNISLQPTGLSVKHSAREKSRMLATEARG
jgi:hypothetical protein